MCCAVGGVWWWWVVGGRWGVWVAGDGWQVAGGRWGVAGCWSRVVVDGCSNTPSQSWADANIFASLRTGRERILTTRNAKTRHR